MPCMNRDAAASACSDYMQVKLVVKCKSQRSIIHKVAEVRENFSNLCTRETEVRGGESARAQLQ